MEIGKDWLKVIFSNGLSEKKPIIPISFQQLEQAAEKRLHKKAFEYIFTGAGNNLSVKNNLEAFQRFKIHPPMLQGVENPKLDTQILGCHFPLPFYFSPIGVLELAHPNADLELAQAAKNSGLTMVISNQASRTMESCNDLLGSSNHWFQLYFSKSKELVESFVHRAENSACTALVITLDTTTIGWRTMDLDNAFLPFILGKGLAQYTSDPIFYNIMNRPKYSEQNQTNHIKPNFSNAIQILKSYPDTLINNFRTKNPIKSIRCFLDVYSNPNLNWEDLRWLRSITKLPIILKGILRRDDALKALDFGADGIIISNHGGRQINQSIASIDALQSIKKIVPSNYPLLLDSGIRNGTDLFIALALGAQAIGLGRPYVYALALAGHKGVEAYVQNLATELMIVMSLCGCKTLADIQPELLDF